MARKTEELLTKQQAADEIGVAVRTVEQYITDGHLSVVRKPVRGRRLGSFVPRRSIDRFLRDLERRSD